MSITKPAKKTIAKYAIIALTMLLVGNQLDGLLAFGVFIGAVYCGNVWMVSLMYIAGSCIGGVDSIINCGIRVAVILAILLIHRWCHKQIGKKLLILYVLAANIFYFVYGYTDLSDFVDKIVNVAVGAIFAFVSIYTLRSVFVRGLKYKPALDEIICMGLYWLVCCYCLSNVNVGIYSPIMFIAPLALLLMLYIAGDMASLVTAILCSLAVVLAKGQYQYMLLYILMSLVAIVCLRLNRYISALSVVVVDVVVAYFADIYATFDIYVLIPVAVASIICLLIPNRCIATCKDIIGATSQYSGKSIVNKLRTSLSSRLYQLSVVFLSMKNIFLSMAGGAIGKNEAKLTLVKNICDNVCHDCQRRSDCWRNNIAATEHSLLSLCECAIERGKATILDIAPNITTSCSRLSTLLGYINSQAESYNSYLVNKTTTNNSRLLIGEQLGGVAQLMGKLSQELKGRLVFDSGKEQEIVAQLVFYNILATEAVFIDNNSATNIILTVATKDIDGDNICDIVGKIVKQKMYIEKTESTNSPSWSNLYLAVAPQYSLSYGIRTVTKHNSEMSGDTHSFVSIDGGKCLLSVCDGMGSGQQAEQVSNIAITLVENFYKAGFDNDIILSCVNRLMAGYNSEVFTAVDICVVDLGNGLADFIKLGACQGLTRCNGEVNIIVGNSLPLGAINTVAKPSITKKALISGDLILLASDGLWDTVDNSNIVADIVSTTVSTNPQIIADTIMDKALSMCNNRPIDDITIIVARVI